MLPPPFVLSTDKRQNRSLIQDVTSFLNNIIFQYTNPIPFETEPHIIHTIPLGREHCDSYLYYIRYKTFEIPPSPKPLSSYFNPVKGISTGTYYRTVHPQTLDSLSKMCSLLICKNLSNSIKTKIHHFTSLLI